MVTSWSPHDHLVVASWSPRGNIYVDPPALIGFFEAYAGPIWGDSGEVTRIYTSRDIGPQNSPEYTPSTPRVHPEYTPSTPRVHLQSTTVAAAGATTGKGPRSRTPSCDFGDRCVAITLDPNAVHLSPRLIYRCISRCISRFISSCWL